ncbi:ABC transporter permease [Microbacterium sp. dk485]|uniref:ABC transporter permease n=1 Tax=Microbacterium TaxID=33882 RepID=UPI0010749DC4|nr:MULTISPECIES: ABC transporter permease [Microbacterium]TFV84124.1 ABC transporter permease [Microbacterium sp. dk485]TXK16064.1 ABC transporter permease [Microbacterium wangchenii]
MKRLIHYGKLLLSSFVLFLVVISVLFLLLEAAPGDPVLAILGESPVTEEFVELMRQTYGLDRPVWERYLIYVGNVLTGNLGYSYLHAGQPVLTLVLDRMGPTLALAIPAFLISTAGGLVFGAIAARTRKRWLDSLISGSAIALFSVPNFWLGMLLLLTFSIELGWLPIQGTSPRGQSGIQLQYLILPVLAMATTELAYKTRIMRASVIEALGQDYIDTARSKGLTERETLWRHALPNALLPMVTVAGYSLGSLVAGSVVIEQVFGWPGMGLMFVESVQRGNNQLVLGIVVVLTFTIIVVNILTDMVYGLVDPRVRESLASSKREVSS